MLTLAHVRALRENPSPTMRAEIAAAVGDELSAAALGPLEQRIAAQILDALAQDNERRVRQALAEHVKECRFLPREIALTLARDIEDPVALPLLEHSPVLEDEDLLACIAGGLAARQIAIARRASVSPPVADALIETRDREVVGTVLANPGAELGEPTLGKIIERYRGETELEVLVIDRPSLPLTICEVLMASVSASLRRRLVAKHQLPDVLADELALHGRERALTQLLDGQDGAAAERVVRHLHEQGRLTASLVLRALCHGDLCFFDAAMAALAGIPTMSARSLLYDRGAGGLRGIYQSSGLPPDLFRAFRAVVNAVLDGELRRGNAVFAAGIVDRLVLLYDDLAPGTLEQVLAQLARRTRRPEGSEREG